MLQSMGSQRAGHDWVTEYQQQSESDNSLFRGSFEGLMRLYLDV